MPHRINVLFDFTMDVPSSDWTRSRYEQQEMGKNTRRRSTEKNGPASDKSIEEGKGGKGLSRHIMRVPSRSGKLATSFVNGLVYLLYTRCDVPPSFYFHLNGINAV